MGATGRIPNIETLGLNEIGLKTGKQGNIIVNEFNQTNIESIYAIGDVTDRINLTPVAIAEGHAFSDREFGNKNRFISYDNVPSAVFSQPPVSVVGLTLEGAKALNINAKEFVSEFNPLKNTITGKQEKTLMKLVVDENDKVLGAHMLGDYSPEIIQGIAVSIKAGAKKSDFDATIGIHPTAAEEFVTMK
jgi:glutathione reductase (NADPH)